MDNAIRLNELIKKISSKLMAEGIDLNDYDACIECLSKTVSPTLCIEIYENYINY